MRATPSAPACAALLAAAAHPRRRADCPFRMRGWTIRRVVGRAVGETLAVRIGSRPGMQRDN